MSNLRNIRLTRDHFLLVLLLVVIGGFSVFVAWRQSQIQEAQQVLAPYTTYSALDRGTLGLYQWAEQIGYRPRRIEYSDFQIGDDTRLLFVLAPSETIERNEALYILDWVERGNILVLADDSVLADNGLLDALEISLNFQGAEEPMRITQPLADHSIGELANSARRSLEIDDGAFVAYAVNGDYPNLVRIPRGSGAIWLTTSPEIFTNQNLRDEDNAALAAALLAQVDAGSEIAFDEYHHGFQADDAASLNTVIYNTPWGWSLLFAGLVMFGYLAFNGQRFGRILPVSKTLARRSPSEYVTSMANLFRRANKRGMVLEHYRHSLKRRLGRPFHLDPELEDSRYIEMIERLRPDLDRAELTHLLNSLRRTNTTEADLVKTIEQSVTFGGRGK